jgi:hypothetical protein
MTDPNSGKQPPTAKTNDSSAVDAKSRVRSSVFKYYIHDSVDTLRFQLLGNLSEYDVSELNGCWNTAKTTLGKRKLVIDLRALKSADESGKEWLLSMANEGAIYLPESYFRTGLSGQNSSPNSGGSRNVGILTKLISVFRPSRDLPAESYTNTVKADSVRVTGR